MGDLDEHKTGQGNEDDEGENKRRVENQEPGVDIPSEEEISVLDLTNHIIKQDQFEGIHILDGSFEKVEGAPNFRKIQGFPIFGTGQPTENAMVG